MLPPKATAKECLEVILDHLKKEFILYMDGSGAQNIQEQAIFSAIKWADDAKRAAEQGRKEELFITKGKATDKSAFSHVANTIREILCSSDTTFTSAREELGQVIDLRSWVNCLAGAAALPFGWSALLAPVISAILMWIMKYGLDQFCKGKGGLS